MIACPGVSGADGLASASSFDPAALWTIPDMPLPASNDGLAEITNISEFILTKFARTSFTIPSSTTTENRLIKKYPGIDTET